MLKPKSSKIPKPTRYQNAAIDYYMGLTNSSYLHYGYWEPLPTQDEELTLRDFQIKKHSKISYNNPLSSSSLRALCASVVRFLG